jgi:uncharacterized protein GlcG (DUF336 family)
MLRFHTLAVIALTGISAATADPLPTETFKVLPLTLAVEAAQAAIAACKADGFAVTAAVVDRAGNLQVLLAGDGVSVLSRDITRRKAYTAAVRRIATTELAKAIAAPGAFNPTLYDTQMVAVGGGVPIKLGNQVIGGIGVGGTPSGEKDEACANAGIAKVSDRLN